MASPGNYSACNIALKIDGGDCIGTSRTTINDNFAAIENLVCNLSTAPMQVTDSNTIDLTYTTATRTLTADVRPGVISTQELVTEASVNDNFLLYQNSSGSLKRIPAGYIANNFFRATESYSVLATNLTVASIYVDQTGNPTANGTAITTNPTNIWRRLNTIDYSSGSFAALKQVGGSANGTYVELSAGLYDISAGANMHSVDTHCIALVQFTPGLTNYTTIATGTLASTDVDGATFDSVTSYTRGRFNFTTPVGIGLVNIYTGKYGKLNPTIGGKPFPTVPAWMAPLLPAVDTAWIEITKVASSS